MTIVLTPRRWIALAVSDAAVGVVCLRPLSPVDPRVVTTIQTHGSRPRRPPSSSVAHVGTATAAKIRAGLPRPPLQSP